MEPGFYIKKAIELFYPLVFKNRISKTIGEILNSPV